MLGPAPTESTVDLRRLQATLRPRPPSYLTSTPSYLTSTRLRTNAERARSRCTPRGQEVTSTARTVTARVRGRGLRVRGLARLVLVLLLLVLVLVKEAGQEVRSFFSFLIIIIVSALLYTRIPTSNLQPPHTIDFLFFLRFEKKKNLIK